MSLRKVRKKFEKVVGSSDGQFIFAIGWADPKTEEWVEGSPWTYWVMQGSPNNVRKAICVTSFKSLEEAENYLKKLQGE